jgi:hypothetical protein
MLVKLGTHPRNRTGTTKFRSTAAKIARIPPARQAHIAVVGMALEKPEVRAMATPVQASTEGAGKAQTESEVGWMIHGYANRKNKWKKREDQ